LGQTAQPISNFRTGEVTAGNQEAPADQNMIVPLAVATLSVLPQKSHTLWFGIWGRNLLMILHFTSTERDKAKYNYHQRKVVSDDIAALVWVGGYLTLRVTEFMKSMVVSYKYHQ
jgi:hypothetical protein